MYKNLMLVLAYLMIGEGAIARNFWTGQIGLNRSFEEGDAISQDLMFGYALANPNTTHSVSTVLERSPEDDGITWLTGIGYSAEFPLSGKFSISPFAQAMVDLTGEPGNILLEENLQLGYKVGDRITLQLGTALQFSEADRFSIASPEMNFSLNFDFKPRQDRSTPEDP